MNCELLAILCDVISWMDENVTAFQAVGGGLLTLLISFSVFIIGSINDGSYKKLDLHIVLSKVINTKDLIFALGFIFFCPLFWSLSPWWGIKLFLLAFYCIGVFICVEVLKKLLEWLLSNQKKWDMRMNYLEELAEKKNCKEEKFIIWKDIFSEKRTYEEEHELWIRFEKTLEKSWEHSNGIIKSQTDEFIGLLEYAIWNNGNAERGHWLLEKLDTPWADHWLPRGRLIWHIMRKVIIGDADFLGTTAPGDFPQWLEKGEKKKEVLGSMLKMMNQLNESEEKVKDNDNLLHMIDLVEKKLK